MTVRTGTTPLGSTAWLLIDRIIGMLVSFVVGVWIARQLGPEAYGVLGFATALVMMFSAFGLIGIDQIVLRELSRAGSDGQHAEILGSALLLRIVGSLLSAGGILLCGFLMRPHEPVTLTVVALLSLSHLMQSVDVVWLLLQSRFHTRPIVLISKSTLVVTTAARVFLLLSAADVRWFAAMAIAEAAIIATAGFIYARIAAPLAVRWTWSRQRLRQLLADGWPLFFSLLLIGLYARIDQILVAQWLPAADMGLYSISIQLADIWLFVPMAIVSAWMPYFVELRERDPVAYDAQLRLLYSTVFYLGAACALVFTLLGPRLLTALYGPAYQGAATALALRAWGNVFVAQALVRGIWLVSENRQVYRLYANIACVVLSLPLNAWLIPRWGITGGALVVAGVQLFATWAFPLLFPAMRHATMATIAAAHPRHAWTVLRMLGQRLRGSGVAG